MKKDKCFCEGEEVFRSVCKECNDWLNQQFNLKLKRVLKRLKFVDDTFTIKIIKKEFNLKELRGEE